MSALLVTDNAAGARERSLLGRIIGFSLALGLVWSFLPGGLVFDPVAREALIAAGVNTGLFAQQVVPILVLCVFAMALRFELTGLLLRELNPWMLLLLAMALVSMAWSPTPFSAFKQAVGISGATLLPLALGLYGWHRQRYVEIMRPLLTLALLASLAVGLLLPNIGIHSEASYELNGSWRGITYQKNGLGQISAMALIFWFHAWASRSEPLRLTVPALALSVLLLLLSRSSTSFLVAVMACGLMFLRLRPALRLGSFRPVVIGTAWMLLLVAVLGYLMFVGSFDGKVIAQSFGELFGKDATFSGRTQIWAEVIQSIRQHPLLGVGFNSFWGGPGSPADGAIRRLGFACNSGHNGYLDVINTLGFVGFFILLAFIRRQFSDIALLSRVDPAQGSLHFAILFYCVLVNMSESGWMVPISIMHTMAVYSSVVVSRHLFDARLLAARQLAASRATPLGHHPISKLSASP